VIGILLTNLENLKGEGPFPEIIINGKLRSIITKCEIALSYNCLLVIIKTLLFYYNDLFNYALVNTITTNKFLDKLNKYFIKNVNESDGVLGGIMGKISKLTDSFYKLIGQNENRSHKGKQPECIAELVMHFYYCKENKLSINTITKSKDYISKIIHELKKAKDYLKQSGMLERCYSSLLFSPFTEKFIKEDPEDNESLFGEDRKDYNNVFDCLIRMLKSENEKPFCVYEKQPYRTISLNLLIGFIIRLILQKQSLEIMKNMQDMFIELFISLHDKYRSVKYLLELIFQFRFTHTDDTESVESLSEVVAIFTKKYHINTLIYNSKTLTDFRTMKENPPKQLSILN
jgi:hypothetical protein